MVQEFSLRYPLVDGQGNFGSIDGDPPAAMRYTEARLAKIAHELLADIDKDTVDFAPNFDESLQEPMVLPTKVPEPARQRLLRASRSAWPPTSRRTTSARWWTGSCMLIDEPGRHASTELMKVIPGPDFPDLRATSTGAAGIREAYTTGRGIITLRAKAHVEKMRGGREAIIVTELPYQVNKASLMEKIGELIRDKKIEGISERRDESSREGIRIVLELGRGEIPQIVINQLYKHTPMQTTFGVIMLALVGRRPAGREPQADAPGVHRASAARSSPAGRSTISRAPKSARTSSRACARRSTSSTSSSGSSARPRARTRPRTP